MPGQPKFFTKNLKRSGRSIPVLLLAVGSAYGANGKMPIDDTELKLTDGRMIEAVRCGTLCHCLVVTRAKKILRKQCYEEEFDRLWNYAFFIPVKPGKYVTDVDGDGNPEIGIATWDGGNNIINRYGLAFSLKGNKLVYFGRKKFNLEYGEYLYGENEKK
jgi:hypothetical protein